jgi:hypothetical protein
MALSRHGKRLGMAAVLEIQDNRLYIQERQAAEIKRRKAQRDETNKINAVLHQFLSPRAYDEWWQTTPDDNAGFLAASRAKLTEVLTDLFAPTGKYMLAAAKLYRGTFIWRSANGQTLIFTEAHGPVLFDNEAEAQGFVDATLAMSGSLLGALA